MKPKVPENVQNKNNKTVHLLYIWASYIKSSISSSQLWSDLSLQILSWIYVVRLPMPAVSLTIDHFTVLQVLSAATIVAKHTSALCNACRLASSKTTNPVAKRHFVQSAKEVANSTANLVKTIKVCFYLVKSLITLIQSVLMLFVSYTLFKIPFSHFPGFRWWFLRGKQEQVSSRHGSTNWSCWKLDNICFQPRVCQRAR